MQSAEALTSVSGAVVAASQVNDVNEVSKTEDELQRKELRRPIAEGPTFLRSKMVVIHVGEEPVEFSIHQHILCEMSNFFKNALNGKWTESSGQTVELPEEDPEVFEMYAAWLYSGRLFIKEDDDEGSPGSDGYDQDFEINKWSDCYKLGDFLQDNNFRDFLIDMMIEKMIIQDTTIINFGDMIYSFSSVKSLHRKLAVDIAANLWFDYHFEELPRKLCKEYLEDILAKIGPCHEERPFGINPEYFFGDIDPCQYHDHTLDKSECYKEKMKCFSVL